MKRYAYFVYGALSYVFFFLVFLYLIGFTGNLFVPKSVDSGVDTPLAAAIAINLLLIALFGIQHSVMARKGFKDWWTKSVPWPIERSTYVLASSLVLVLLYWQWRPIDTVIWDVQNAAGRNALLGLFFFGWGLLLYSTFLINHFDLFGLRQVFLELRGKEYTPVGFKLPWLYSLVRHPLYLGFVIALWATPTMTIGHALLAAGFTSYILVGIHYEEKDLAEFHGDDYLQYKQSVSMLVPMPPKEKKKPGQPRPA